LIFSEEVDLIYEEGEGVGKRKKVSGAAHELHGSSRGGQSGFKRGNFEGTLVGVQAIGKKKRGHITAA